MQENLDVLLSFVVVIIGLSILLQIVVDAIKNFLKLRWAIYEKFFEDVYRSLFTDREPAKQEQGSVFARAKDFISKRKERAKIGSIESRFKDFYKKIISLADDVENLKKVLIETKTVLSTKGDAEIMTFVVSLTDKTGLIPSRLKSVNLGDLFSIYNRLYKVLGVSCDDITGKKYFAEVKKFHEAIGKVEKMIEEVKDLKLKQQVISTINDILAGIEDIENLVIDYRARLVNNVDNWLQDLENIYTRSIATWAFWIGLVLVIALNADSRVIYTTLKNEPVVRAGIIEQSKTLTENINMPERGKAINDLGNKVNEIKRDMAKDKKIDKNKYELFLAGFKSLSDAISEDAEAFKDKSRQITLPYDLTQGAEKKSEFLESLEGYRDKTNVALSEKEIYEIGDRLDSTVLRISRNYVSFAEGAINSQRELLYSTGLPLGWNSQRFNELFENEFYIDMWNVFKKILGLLTTAILISFGAPFWNDVLKSLFGLRTFLRRSETPVKNGSQTG
jgi:hypothetical protein